MKSAEPSSDVGTGKASRRAVTSRPIGARSRPRKSGTEARHGWRRDRAAARLRAAAWRSHRRDRPVRTSESRASPRQTEGVLGADEVDLAAWLRTLRSTIRNARREPLLATARPPLPARVCGARRGRRAGSSRFQRGRSGCPRPHASPQLIPEPSASPSRGRRPPPPRGDSSSFCFCRRLRARPRSLRKRRLVGPAPARGAGVQVTGAEASRRRAVTSRIPLEERPAGRRRSDSRQAASTALRTPV